MFRNNVEFFFWKKIYENIGVDVRRMKDDWKGSFEGLIEASEKA